MVSHVGKIAEALQGTCCRIFHVLTAVANCEMKTSSWATARGGFGGDGSLPAPVAAPADDDALEPAHILMPS
eukprot:8423350-Pyramimonas_sp.AAC.1